MKTAAIHTDPELVALLKQKEPQAFTFLYEKYGAAIYGLIRQVLPDPRLANETFVEAFITIARSIDQHDSSKSRLFTWIIQKARQTAIEKLKSISARTYPEVGVNPPKASFMQGLSPNLDTDQQAIIELAYLKGYSAEEIARLMALPVETIKQRMNKALIAINSQAKK